MSKQRSPVAVGIIGFGSMGSALAGAIGRSKELGAWLSLSVYAKGWQPADNTRQCMRFVGAVQELISHSDIIIIAVRPEQVRGVIDEAARCLPAAPQARPKILVSIAAGIPLAFLAEQAGQGFSVARIMPNTLVAAGKGLFGLCPGPGLGPEQKDLLHAVFGALGKVVELDEADMNAFTALAGCGPGFLFHIMDSFCEAGVSVGLGREASRAIATGLMEGCAALATMTGRHPAVLREEGTSPAGMTIAGLNHMDTTGIRGHVIDAVKTALARGKAMDREATQKAPHATQA